jgi:hypothetical protein
MLDHAYGELGRDQPQGLEQLHNPQQTSEWDRPPHGGGDGWRNY